MQHAGVAHPGRSIAKVSMKDEARSKASRSKAGPQAGEPAATASGSVRTKSNDGQEDGPRGGYGEPETTGLSQLSDIVTLESAPQHVEGALSRGQEQHGLNEQVRSSLRSPSLSIGRARTPVDGCMVNHNGAALRRRRWLWHVVSTRRRAQHVGRASHQAQHALHSVSIGISTSVSRSGHCVDS